ncbi:MAG: hypothetical protein CMJ24_03395 [Phycisphaerae bacterium]|nr:hypothetical protein [Phycisphaerae bacterium]
MRNWKQVPLVAVTALTAFGLQSNAEEGNCQVVPQVTHQITTVDYDPRIGPAATNNGFLTEGDLQQDLGYCKQYFDAIRTYQGFRGTNFQGTTSTPKAVVLINAVNAGLKVSYGTRPSDPWYDSPGPAVPFTDTEQDLADLYWALQNNHVTDTDIVEVIVGNEWCFHEPPETPDAMWELWCGGSLNVDTPVTGSIKALMQKYDGMFKEANYDIKITTSLNRATLQDMGSGTGKTLFKDVFKTCDELSGHIMLNTYPFIDIKNQLSITGGPPGCEQFCWEGFALWSFAQDLGKSNACPQNSYMICNHCCPGTSPTTYLPCYMYSANSNCFGIMETFAPNGQMKYKVGETGWPSGPSTQFCSTGCTNVNPWWNQYGQFFRTVDIFIDTQNNTTGVYGQNSFVTPPRLMANGVYWFSWRDNPWKVVSGQAFDAHWGIAPTWDAGSGANNNTVKQYYKQWLRSASTVDGDTNNDGVIDQQDLDNVLHALGSCRTDSNLDGTTDIHDLLAVIDKWGQCE